MKLLKNIRAEEDGFFGNKRIIVRLNLFRIVPSGKSIEGQKVELCRDIMHELGLTEKEMIDLENREEAP